MQGIADISGICKGRRWMRRDAMEVADAASPSTQQRPHAPTAPHTSRVAGASACRLEASRTRDDAAYRGTNAPSEGLPHTNGTSRPRAVLPCPALHAPMLTWHIAHRSVQRRPAQTRESETLTLSATLSLVLAPDPCTTAMGSFPLGAGQHQDHECESVR